MVINADCSDVGAFVEQLRPHYAGEIVVGDIGPVVGSHAGRGTIGIVLRRELATHLSRAGPHIGLSTTERADKRWPSVRLPGNEGGSPLSSTNGHV